MSDMIPNQKPVTCWQDKKLFRSVDEWRSALMTLPDSSFFELLRSIFGNIKTPFSKQRLLDDLFIFLSRSETRKVIAAYINEKDKKIIAAVAVLNEPVPGEMENFFEGELPGTEIHTLLMNLEERLIVYRFRSDGILRLALNPVLEDLLMPIIMDTNILLPSFFIKSGFPPKGGFPNIDASPSACVADGRIMAALFAFIYGEEELFKSERGIRKKVLEDWKKFLPALDFELCVRTLLLLGLCRRGNSSRNWPESEVSQSEGRCLVPCADRIADFAVLSPLERQAYWTAGVYICLEEEKQEGEPAGDSACGNSSNASEGSYVERAIDGFSDDASGVGLFSRNRLRSFALIISKFKSFMDPKMKYPGITLKRFWDLLEKEEKGIRNYPGFDGKVQVSFEFLLSVMEKTGFLEREEGYWKAGPGLALPQRSDSDREARKPVIAMDSAFSIILYPEISFADALKLGIFCSVKENTGRLPGSHEVQESSGSAETTICFELTRDSVIRGYDQGMTADSMTKFLSRLSFDRIDANLGWTLKEWENRYGGVSLHQGIILALAEDRRYLAEVKPVASLIRRTLAPGVYLISPEDRFDVSKALKKAGVDIIAHPPSGSAAASFSRMHRSFPSLGSPMTGTSLSNLSLLKSTGKETNLQESENSPNESGEFYGESEIIRQNLYRILETMHLTKQEKDELSARIDRRLVLSEAQLDKSSLRYEKLEARGLDYPGKLAIAKQANDSGSMVEVSWPCSGGGINRAIGHVQGLEKKEAEIIIILKVISLVEERNIEESIHVPGNTIRIPGNTIRIPGNTIRIPLGKISLFRRIKQSIFGE